MPIFVMVPVIARLGCAYGSVDKADDSRSGVDGLQRFGCNESVQGCEESGHARLGPALANARDPNGVGLLPALSCSALGLVGVYPCSDRSACR